MKHANNGRNPSWEGLSFQELHGYLMWASEDGLFDPTAEVGVGNNTVASWRSNIEPASIEIHYHETMVAIVWPNAVQLFDGGYKTKATGARMDWVLVPLGYRLSKRGSGGRVRWGREYDEFKIYSINTGAYRDYHEGMIVERGAF